MRETNIEIQIEFSVCKEISGTKKALKEHEEAILDMREYMGDVDFTGSNFNRNKKRIINFYLF